MEEQIKTLSEKLKAKLHESGVVFKYKKVNGDIREAYGTLNIQIMGEENQPHGNDKYQAPKDVIRYYDLNSKGWRSFREENLISIEDVDKS